VKRFLLPILCAIASAAFAQSTPSENFSLAWAPGQIHFKSGDTLNCNLRFNQNAGHHILQVEEDGQVVTLPIKDVRSFSYVDATRNRHRLFSSFQNPDSNIQEYYMEHIYASREFTILNRKTMEVPAELNFSRFIGKPVKTHKKYICHAPSGKILPLTRESLFALLEPNRDKVLAFVKDHGIRFRRIADFIQVFEYYNSL
jgi:hypothetical protein